MKPADIVKYHGLLSAGEIADNDLIPIVVGGALKLVPAGEVKEIANNFATDPLFRYNWMAGSSGSQVVTWLSLGNSIAEGGSADHVSEEKYMTKCLRLQQARHGNSGGGYGYANCSSGIQNGSGAGAPYWTFGGGGSHGFGGFTGWPYGGDIQAVGTRLYNFAVNEPATLHWSGTSIIPHFMQGNAASTPMTMSLDGAAASTITPLTTGGKHTNGLWVPADHGVSPLSAGSHTALFTPASGTTLPLRGSFVKNGDEGHGLVLIDHALGGTKSTDYAATNGPGTTAGLADVLSMCTNLAAAFLEFGTNDLHNGGTAAAFKTAIQSTIIPALKAGVSTQPTLVLVLTQYIGMSDYITKANEIAAADPGNVVVFDTNTLSTYATADGIHPTTAAHAAIGSALDAFLAA